MMRQFAGYLLLFLIFLSACQESSKSAPANSADKLAQLSDQDLPPPSKIKYTVSGLKITSYESVPGFGKAFKDADGLLWSEDLGVMEKDQAIQLCEKIGGRLPTISEIQAFEGMNTGFTKDGQLSIDCQEYDVNGVSQRKWIFTDSKENPLYWTSDPNCRIWGFCNYLSGSYNCSSTWGYEKHMGQTHLRCVK